MGTSVDRVRQKEVGPNLPNATSVTELLSKRRWIKETISVLLTHVTYHRNHKEEFSLPKSTVLKVGESDGKLKL